MYVCMSCGSRFPEEDASVKTLYVRIHGDEDSEDIDVCPYCGSDELAYTDDVEEE